MKLTHLRGRKVADLVRRKGRIWRGKTLTVYWLPGAPRSVVQAARGIALPPALYAGTFASSKLSKKAVERNRMRRRCREALRVTVKQLSIPSSAQLLLLPQSSSLRAPFTAILADIQGFLFTSLHARQ